MDEPKMLEKLSQKIDEQLEKKLDEKFTMQKNDIEDRF
jgi:hypothetical protein